MYGEFPLNQKFYPVPQSSHQTPQNFSQYQEHHKKSQAKSIGSYLCWMFQENCSLAPDILQKINSELKCSCAEGPSDPNPLYSLPSTWSSTAIKSTSRNRKQSNPNILYSRVVFMNPKTDPILLLKDNFLLLSCWKKLVISFTNFKSSLEDLSRKNQQFDKE